MAPCQGRHSVRAGTLRAAETVAAITIGLAEVRHMRVSATHVLCSGRRERS